MPRVPNIDVYLYIVYLFYLYNNRQIGNIIILSSFDRHSLYKRPPCSIWTSMHPIVVVITSSHNKINFK